MTTWILINAMISADTNGQYIGYDKSISAYRLSVKFHRYANPGPFQIFADTLATQLFMGAPQGPHTDTIKSIISLLTLCSES